MRHHLRHSRVLGARQCLQAFEQLDLAGRVERSERILRHVQAMPAAPLERWYSPFLPGRGNRPNRRSRIAEGLDADIVRVGKSRFLTRQGAYADALVDAETAGLDDSFLEAPGLGAAVLEIEVGIIDPVRHDFAEYPCQVCDVKTIGCEQGFFGLREQGLSVFVH
ncbi:MAG: hypothetical protein AW09_002752 [Candidatus Accumulibacter phosphatis]|uniref:Uncharacterized protein n=1 Tax=Candidatus Accumulibacter phosphatis TaxID=327160 RepID=A0A080LUB3_9PROT|nr:MAG: hypothetical protein AW09_002752 [Candidatus Accumulibacter phosphatis]